MQFILAKTQSTIVTRQAFLCAVCCGVGKNIADADVKTSADIKIRKPVVWPLYFYGIVDQNMERINAVSFRLEKGTNRSVKRARVADKGKLAPTCTFFFLVL